MTVSATTQGLKPGVCLSTARPVAPFDGQVIYMTDVDQTAVWDGTAWVVLAPIASGRNMIINGDMRIDQRNSGAALNPVGVVYTVDRWAHYASQTGKLSFQQNQSAVTPPVGFSYYSGFTSLSAFSIASSDQFLYMQKVEGYNFAKLNWGTANAKTATLSFWVRSSLTGTFGGSIQNSAQNRCFPYSYTISSANTWEYKTVVITGDTTGTWLTTNGIGAHIHFSLATGSTYSGTAGEWVGTSYISSVTGAVSVVGTNAATWQVTGVQLEAGAVATPYEFEDYGTTLAKCQRYYYRDNAVLPYSRYGVGSGASTTSARIDIKFPVTMRTYWSSVDYNLLALDDNASLFAVTSVTALANATSFNEAAISCAATGLTQFRFYHLESNNSTSGYIGFSAEL
jgi:hypothetical protein